MFARGLVSLGSKLQWKLVSTMRAQAWILPICRLKQLTTAPADKHVRRVPDVFGDQEVRKQVGIHVTVSAVSRLNPHEILRSSFITPATQTSSAVEMADLLLQVGAELFRRLLVCRHIQLQQFLPHDPPRHGVHIRTSHSTTNAVRLHHRRAATHEGIKDPHLRHLLALIECLVDWLLSKLGQDQRAKERPWSPGKPFVHGNDGTVVLLDLFFPQSQSRHKRHFKMAFNHPFIVALLCGMSSTFPQDILVLASGRGPTSLART